MDFFIDIILDAFLDTLKVWPLLFLTYLFMEYIEHKAGDRMVEAVRRSGRSGPLWGALLGIIPQCGLSSAAAGFYSGRIITVGTLMAVFLSTSDEMLPILISATVPVSVILKILGLKVVIAMVAGFIIDACWKPKNEEEHHFCTICQDEHCGCEKSIFRGALHHSLHIAAFLFLISFVLGLIISTVGLKELHGSVLSQPYVGVCISALVGLIPNCAASVVITQLYLDQLFSSGAMMAGLLVNAGVGLLVLFRVNRHWKENLRIVVILLGIGIAAGFLLQSLQVVF